MTRTIDWAYNGLNSVSRYAVMLSNSKTGESYYVGSTPRTSRSALVFHLRENWDAIERRTGEAEWRYAKGCLVTGAWTLKHGDTLRQMHGRTVQTLD